MRENSMPMVEVVHKQMLISSMTMCIVSLIERSMSTPDSRDWKRIAGLYFKTTKLRQLRSP